MIKILSRSLMFLSIQGAFFALVAGLIMAQPAPANAAYQICKQIEANGRHFAKSHDGRENKSGKEIFSIKRRIQAIWSGQ